MILLAATALSVDGLFASVGYATYNPFTRVDIVNYHPLKEAVACSETETQAKLTSLSPARTTLSWSRYLGMMP